MYSLIISNSRLQRTSVMSVSNRSICCKIPSRTNILDKYCNSTLLLAHLTYIWKESLVSVWWNLVYGFTVWRRSRRGREKVRQGDNEKERSFATHIDECIKSGIKRKLEVNNRRGYQKEFYETSLAESCLYFSQKQNCFLFQSLNTNYKKKM